MFEGFERRVENIDGIDIAFVIGGSGPPVLMLHGYPQTHALWARVAPQLAQNFTVVCADLRGYGASSKPPAEPDSANYSFRALASDQVGLMRRLGFPRFHLVGHDRGARTGHRLALDHPDALRSLTLMDIAPTYTLFMRVDRRLAAAYWHWYFLQQPQPFPERLIGADPDFFFEICLFGWGAATKEDFDPEMLDAYRRAWRDPAMIHGSCSDYRAAAGVDLDLDTRDLARTIDCPTLILYGAQGVMAKLFDLPEEWRPICPNMAASAMPGGHFFIDQHPDATATRLRDFLQSHSN
jgi:haloacetate dehalogenase